MATKPIAVVEVGLNDYGRLTFSYSVNNEKNILGHRRGLFDATPELIEQLENLINNGRARYPHRANKPVKIQVPEQS